MISDLESFDSNPECLPGEDEEDLGRNVYAVPSPNETKTQTSLLPAVNSGTWKRQSYRSIAINSRLRRQNGPAISPQQPQSSFDSIDTIETSSTEPSRMDHVTTSFESSATDSTNGTEAAIIQPSVSHRMLSLRNDSGYRSLESAAVPAPRLTKALAATLSLSEDDINEQQRTEGSSPSAEQCQCRSQVLHDEKCERFKPIVFARCTRYGMKTRSSSTSGNSQQPSAGWRHQQRLQQHTQSQQFLTRDYSIDERTDAIFREFSRCDPVYDGSGSKNVGGSRGELRTAGFSHRTRWINQHQRHDNQHHYQHRFLSFQDPSHPLVSDTSDSLLQHCSLQE